MKVLVRLLVLYVALAAGWHVYVQRTFPRGYDWRIVAVMAAGTLVPLLVYASAWTDIVDAFRAARAPRPVAASGVPAALGGRIVSPDRELVSPFLRQPCLAYAWAVSAWQTSRQGSRSRTTVRPEYRGHVEAALSLRTGSGDVRLLREGAGTLLERVADAPGTNGRRDADKEIDLRENARTYFAEARPEGAPATGEIRLDGRYLEESFLPAQTECWVFGVWSGEPAGVRVRRIVLGRRERVVRKLLWGAAGYLVMGAVVTAFFLFCVTLFLRSA